MAGDVGLRALAHATGCSMRHLLAVENGTEPLLPSDAQDIAVALNVPAEWLRDGWERGTGLRSR
jgi:hypothetical protein